MAIKADAGGEGAGTRSALAEINVIPLVDVVLVLLLIFMLTAPMMYRGIDVNLPRSGGKPTAVEERLVLTPKPRGTLSQTLFELMRSRPDQLGTTRGLRPEHHDDAQISLWALYELSYRGFEDVEDSLEWHPDLVVLRRELEAEVETALREPLLEVGRLRVVAYRLLEQLALDAEPDGIRRGIADASLATPLGSVERMKQLGAEMRGAKWAE